MPLTKFEGNIDQKLYLRIGPNLSHEMMNCVLLNLLLAGFSACFTQSSGLVHLSNISPPPPSHEPQIHTIFQVVEV